MCEFEVSVAKEDFKFSCAHFIAYKGFRERLHGHNYRAYIKITGSNCINDDGYVIDFGDIKREVRALCKSINEFFICPTKTTDMVITEIDGNVCLLCEDGAKFSFPKSDCAMLPIYHSSAEELAHWLWCRVIR
jgi:6-pyruvoyl-tetrahydropterin synthase